MRMSPFQCPLYFFYIYICTHTHMHTRKPSCSPSYCFNLQLVSPPQAQRCGCYIANTFCFLLITPFAQTMPSPEGTPQHFADMVCIRRGSRCFGDPAARTGCFGAGKVGRLLFFLCFNFFFLIFFFFGGAVTWFCKGGCI